MPETWVRSLAWEDPACHGATELVGHNYWACGLQAVRCSSWRPHTLEPGLCNRRGLSGEKPAPQGEAHTARKTQHGQESVNKQQLQRCLACSRHSVNTCWMSEWTNEVKAQLRSLLGSTGSFLKQTLPQLKGVMLGRYFKGHGASCNRGSRGCQELSQEGWPVSRSWKKKEVADVRTRGLVPTPKGFSFLPITWFYSSVTQPLLNHTKHV